MYKLISMYKDSVKKRRKKGKRKKNSGEGEKREKKYNPLFRLV